MATSGPAPSRAGCVGTRRLRPIGSCLLLRNRGTNDCNAARTPSLGPTVVASGATPAARMEHTLTKSRVSGSAAVVLITIAAGCGGSVAASISQDAGVADVAITPVGMSQQTAVAVETHAAISLANATCALEAS